MVGTVNAMNRTTRNDRSGIHAAGVAFAAVGIAALLLAPMPAAAYVGPGAGLSAIGSALALIAAIGLAIVGFIWYPVKRAWRKLSGQGEPSRARAADRGRTEQRQPPAA